ncbi:MAG: RdgB/HAM1 family non-canonical purine NTP pyrophosphatase [Bacteroidetes bacterium]|nr:RdgB/HAM1 family non-canonical purine NTP pyrophosphatase [Bacteroidota bacterium]MBU1678275.1 RdgB/HAM1 family non-canonical purine NTP pyrophosphatase [Bacteroidota bacterium]MBU2507649.1 RdgB/HAM1 family non-canonical purine NTP pyrophosphatase [Bacteroidota bacterium]
MKLIFASENKGKLKEVLQIFSDTNFEIIALSEFGEIQEIIEDGETYYDNALIKAKFIFDLYGTPTIADDSGLSVEQLGGKPGVHSARFAGENCTFSDNNKKLKKELSVFPKPHNAKFISCALFYDGSKIISEIGELPGQIINEFRGSHGFGYDPIFVPDGFNTTLGEMSVEEKNKISHRAISFSKLKNKLIS